MTRKDQKSSKSETPQVIGARFAMKKLSQYEITPVVSGSTHALTITGDNTLLDLVNQELEISEPSPVKATFETVRKLFEDARYGKNTNGDNLREVATHIRTLYTESKKDGANWKRLLDSEDEDTRGVGGDVSEVADFYAAIYAAIYSELQSLAKCTGKSLPKLESDRKR